MLFYSAQFGVEMEKKNGQWNVVEAKESVTIEQNQKPQQAVILDLALSGKLESGVR